MRPRSRSTASRRVASKPPVYYGLAGVSTLSGLETYEVLAPVAALLLAMAALGLFLVATELLGGGTLAGPVAMGLAGLDRMVLHTALHPYFNQSGGTSRSRSRSC